VKLALFDKYRLGLVEGDHVVIRGGNGLAVLPSASNVIQIKPVRW